VFEVQSFGLDTGPQSFCHSSAQKFAARLCQVATVVMTSSSAVAERPRDALYTSVVSFNSVIPGAESFYRASAY